MTYAYNTHGAPAVGGGLPGLPIRQIAQPDSGPLSGEMVFSDSPPEDGEWVPLDGDLWDARLTGSGISPTFSGVLLDTSRGLTQGRIEDLAFSPDSRYLAMACVSGATNILTRAAPSQNSPGGRWRDPVTFAGTSFPTILHAVAYHPSGDLIAFANNGTLQLVKKDGDVFTRQAQSTGNPIAARGLAFSADGEYLYAALTSAPWFRVYKVAEDGNLTTVSYTGVSLPGVPQVLCVSPDGRFIAFAVSVVSGLQVYRVNGAEFEPVSVQSNRGANSADFSADGEELVVSWVRDAAQTGGYQPAVLRFNGTGFVEVPGIFPAFNAGTGRSLQSVAISPDRRAVLAGWGSGVGDGDRVMRMGLLRGTTYSWVGGLFDVYHEDYGVITRTRFSLNGDHVAAGCGNSYSLDSKVAAKPSLSVDGKLAYVKVG